MNAKPPSDQADKIVVRLPDGMRDRLAEVAKENKRSVNAEVVHALERWLSGYGATPAPLEVNNLLLSMQELMVSTPGLSVTFTLKQGEEELIFQSENVPEDLKMSSLTRKK